MIRISERYLFIKTVLPSYIPLSPYLPSNHYNIEKTVLLIINGLGEYGFEKRGVTNPHLPQNHYKIESGDIGIFRGMA